MIVWGLSVDFLINCQLHIGLSSSHAGSGRSLAFKTALRDFIAGHLVILDSVIGKMVVPSNLLS